MTGGSSPAAGHRTTSRVAALLAATGLALTLAACTSAPTGTDAAPTLDADQVVSALGAVPIPTPDTTIPVPVASAGRLQVLSMGNTVHAVLGRGIEATVTAVGPVQAVTTPEPVTQGVEPQTAGTISVTVTAGSRDVAFTTADLVCRDDTGRIVPLASVGPRTVRVRAGATATVVVAGVFRSGAAQLTWQPGGHPLVLWDFTIELD